LPTSRKAIEAGQISVIQLGRFEDLKIVRWLGNDDPTTRKMI
jgi:hypothetical protein